jgi:hypothetical protein
MTSLDMFLDIDFGTAGQIGEFLDGEVHGMHLCLIPTEPHTYALMNTCVEQAFRPQHCASGSSRSPKTRQLVGKFVNLGFTPPSSFA